MWQGRRLVSLCSQSGLLATPLVALFPAYMVLLYAKRLRQWSKQRRFTKAYTVSLTISLIKALEAESTRLAQSQRDQKTVPWVLKSHDNCTPAHPCKPDFHSPTIIITVYSWRREPPPVESWKNVLEILVCWASSLTELQEEEEVFQCLHRYAFLPTTGHALCTFSGKWAVHEQLLTIIMRFFVHHISHHSPGREELGTQEGAWGTVGGKNSIVLSKAEYATVAQNEAPTLNSCCLRPEPEISVS